MNPENVPDATASAALLAFNAVKVQSRTDLSAMKAAIAAAMNRGFNLDGGPPGEDPA